MNKKTIVNGVLLLDKAQGISSSHALMLAKKAFFSPITDSKKAGHTGTLDPMATGLLPICFGQATKFAQFGLDANKSYTATLQLGSQTDTGDKEGQVIATQTIPSFCQNNLDNIAQRFIGQSLQTPPMYAALKKDGKKLYEYARAGLDVERTVRPIVIHDLSLQLHTDDSIHLQVTCSKGTYVRVLAEDIAKTLGTLGHLTALRRTATAGFDVACAIDLDRLNQLDHAQRYQHLLPIDALLSHLPIAHLSDDEIMRLQLGQRLNIKTRTQLLFEQTAATEQLIRLYGDDGFVGLGDVARTGRLQPKKMCQTPL